MAGGEEGSKEQRFHRSTVGSSGNYPHVGGLGEDRSWESCPSQKPCKVLRCLQASAHAVLRLKYLMSPSPSGNLLCTLRVPLQCQPSLCSVCRLHPIARRLFPPHDGVTWPRSPHRSDLPFILSLRKPRGLQGQRMCPIPLCILRTQVRGLAESSCSQPFTE